MMFLGRGSRFIEGEAREKNNDGAELQKYRLKIENYSIEDNPANSNCREPLSNT